MRRPHVTGVALALVLTLAAFAGADPIRQGPTILKPGDHGISSLVPDVTFTDLQGKQHRLSDYKNEKAVVMAMGSTSCPLSKKYLPTLAALSKDFAARQVTFILVNPTASDRLNDMQAAASSLDSKAIYVHDKTGALAGAVGAVTTTDTVVLDGSRTIIYHGAVDDQYGLGYAHDAPSRRLLAEAVAAHLSGRQPLIAATVAPGCALETSLPIKPTAITYHNRISRLMQNHCVECHRTGGVAPFALDNYEDVASHAGMIRKVVERGVMPPWFAAPATPAKPNTTSGVEKKADHGSLWATDRSLADSEKADLLAWLDGGKPRGDEKDAVAPRLYPDGWLIGKPDAVFEFSKPVAIKATGTMPYQNIIVETHLPQDQWIQAIEIQPGAREVVHHVLVFIAGVDRDDEENDQEESDRDPAARDRQGFWAAYVPGNSTLIYPDGYAKKLPKGARLRFQMHYTPTGKATEDRTRIGLVFAKSPPQFEVRVHGIANGRIRIPPYADNHRENATIRLPFDAQILSFMPHMHVRGKACKYEVIRADGTSSTMLNIPHYDFNWQLSYRYFEPVKLSKGDTIEFTAWYDNSDKNPANPDPSKEVRWGPQTFNEMHLGYVEYVVPGTKPGETPALMSKNRIAAGALDRLSEVLFTRLDTDSDGKLTLAEAKKINERARRPASAQRSEAVFKELDSNGDGALNKAEFAKLLEKINAKE